VRQFVLIYRAAEIVFSETQSQFFWIMGFTYCASLLLLRCSRLDPCPELEEPP
jgi:hypothetical protein